jgi:NDP-sugar pyrophosphorylase family protein
VKRVSLTLVVLAAGIGSRYGGLKQMDPVGPSGEVLMDYSLYDALRAGFDRIVFVIRRDIEADFRAHVGARLGGRVETDYIFQELSAVPEGYSVPKNRAKPWGTCHALFVCRNAVDGPFGVINADDLYGRESFRLLADFLRARKPDDTLYCNVAFHLISTLSDHGHVARAICRKNSDGFLESIVERTRIEKDGDGARFTDDDGKGEPLAGNEVVSMNMWGFTPSVFADLEAMFGRFLTEHGADSKAEFFIPAIVADMIRAGCAKVQVLETAAKWLGITYADDKPLVADGIRQRIATGEYPERLYD